MVGGVEVWCIAYPTKMIFFAPLIFYFARRRFFAFSAIGLRPFDVGSIWWCKPVPLACVEVCPEFVSRSAFQTWVIIILPIFLHEKSEREEDPLLWQKCHFFFFFLFFILAEGVLTHYIDHADHESAIKKMLEPIRARQRYVERSFTCFSAMRDIHIFSFKH
jgi:hypothetical protein